MSIVRPFCTAAVLIAAALLAPALATAQTVQFQTGIGNFEVVLNPTADPNLQPLVDNFLQNVETGLFNNVVINRADETGLGEEFVIQLGSFSTEAVTALDLVNAQDFSVPGVEGFLAIDSGTTVITDADNDGAVDFPTLSNTLGTVSLALSGLGPNSGSVSFFVNLNDNSFLDSQGFVPFAEVQDLTVINQIADLTNVDFTAALGLSPANLAFSDIPLTDIELAASGAIANGNLIVVDQAIVVPEPASIAGILAAATTLTFTRRRRR